MRFELSMPRVADRSVVWSSFGISAVCALSPFDKMMGPVWSPVADVGLEGMNLSVWSLRVQPMQDRR